MGKKGKRGLSKAQIASQSVKPWRCIYCAQYALPGLETCAAHYDVKTLDPWRFNEAIPAYCDDRYGV